MSLRTSGLKLDTTTPIGAAILAMALAACSSAHTANKASPAPESSAAPSASAAGDAGPAATTRGCGQGTSCTPGTDLAAPADSDGYQVVTPAGAIAVQPGQEAFMCFYKTLPNTAEVDVGKIQSWMTPGSSHHFIAYQIAPGGGGGFLGGAQQPDGTLQACSFGGGTWMYATSVPGEVIEMKMPDGVGLPLAGGTQIELNMHFINPGSSVSYPQV